MKISKQDRLQVCLRVCGRVCWGRGMVPEGNCQYVRISDILVFMKKVQNLIFQYWQLLQISSRLWADQQKHVWWTAGCRKPAEKKSIYPKKKKNKVLSQLPTFFGMQFHNCENNSHLMALRWLRMKVM